MLKYPPKFQNFQKILTNFPTVDKISKFCHKKISNFLNFLKFCLKICQIFTQFALKTPNYPSLSLLTPKIQLKLTKIATFIITKYFCPHSVAQLQVFRSRRSEKDDWAAAALKFLTFGYSCCCVWISVSITCCLHNFWCF